jgi:hypothetical protein
MKLDTLDELFEHGRDVAKELFEAQGHIAPMWIAVDEEGRIFPIVAPIETDHKDEYIEAIKMIFEEKQVVRYVSLLEAWMVKSPEIPKSHLLGASLASHPDREEVIFITAEDKKGSRTGEYHILRPEHGKPKLGTFKNLGDVKNEGRFTGLLTK